MAGKNYTSTRMITKNKKSSYGRIDIRAKMPKEKRRVAGTWMLGNNIDAVGWPSCGEMDIMELLGQEPNKTYITLSLGATVASHASKGTSYTLSSEVSDQQYHVFSLVGSRTMVRVLVDDVEFVRVTTTDVLGKPPPSTLISFHFQYCRGWQLAMDPDNTTTTFPKRMVGGLYPGLPIKCCELQRPFLPAQLRCPFCLALQWPAGQPPIG